MPGFAAGPFVMAAARKLLMKNTSAMTTIMNSKSRDLLLVALKFNG